MEFIVAVSRIVLPLVALTILVKCLLTLLLGHPKEKIYAYITDNTTGKRYPLNMWETSIGRSKINDIVIDHSSISRSHAVISRRIDGWYICDLHSKFGVYINNARLTGKSSAPSTTISNRDTITLSDRSFTFEIADDPVQLVGKKQTKAKVNSAPPTPTSVRQQSPYNYAFDFSSKNSPRISNHLTGEVYILNGNKVTIGSSNKCDICIRGSKIARNHCTLILYEDGWAIQDSVDFYDTYLNDRKVTSAQLLFNGDVIGIGDQKLYFKN